MRGEMQNAVIAEFTAQRQTPVSRKSSARSRSEEGSNPVIASASWRLKCNRLKTCMPESAADLSTSATIFAVSAHGRLSHALIRPLN